jgi:hypothetical protein
MHVVETLAIESSNYVHNIAEDDRSVKSSWLGLFCAHSFNLGPLSLVDVKLVNIVKPLLVRVNSTKDINLAPAYDGRVPVPWLWR